MHAEYILSVHHNDSTNIFLTPWELVYEYIKPRFWPKTSSFRLPY